MFAHVVVSGVVEHVVSVAGAEQIEEVQPALRGRVRNQVNHSLPICVQNPFFPACRAPVSSTLTHGDISSPGTQNILGFGDEAFVVLVQQTNQLPL